MRRAAVVEERSCGRRHCAAECCQVLSLQGKKEKKKKRIVRADLRYAAHWGELETKLTVTLVKALLMPILFASDSELGLELLTVDKELP